ncbi:MAG TPA: SIS domain-containing protein [Candidatus Eisenbacteria bacterium]|nr:SIS domain-containing protein [Candidatus Eisenbacteria bacterium]
MSADFSVIEGEYLRDILDQPRALDSTFSKLEVSKELRQLASRLQRGSFGSIVLTGMGSSFHALHPLHLELIESGFHSLMVESSELIHYQDGLFDRKNLIVAVSQSGRSAEVVRLLKSNRGRSPIIGVTNTAGSPLAKNAAASVVTDAGEEFSVSCKTYVASLLGLRWLAEVMRRGDLGRIRSDLKSASAFTAEYLASWKTHVQQLGQRLSQARRLFLVGRGPSLAAVGTGSLIVKEADHFPAEGMSSAAFRHGPFEMVGNETFVGVFAGEKKTRELNRSLFQDIRERQGATEWIGEDSNFAPFLLPKAPRSVMPVLEILPVQMITLALAALVGREAGRFTFCSKVTTEE